jgi:predicted NAD/FAD-dependent oxidoreductase
MTTPRIAIIGAGLAGLSLAHALKERAELQMFEKARGVSGRMSTRYADPYQFDHGAQYFTARHPSFQAFLKPLLAAGLVVEWTPKVVTLAKWEAPYKRDWFEPHYVATPRMNRLAQHLAEGLPVAVSVEIAALERQGEGWVLHDKTGSTHGPFDWVISTAPAAQTQKLFPAECTFQPTLAQVQMTGCYTVMIGTHAPLPWHWQAAVVKDSPLGWLAVNHSKPGREGLASSLVVQSTDVWAEAHIDEDVPAMQTLLLEELEALTGWRPAAEDHVATHRWRYAGTATPAGEDCLLDASLRLAACGDWSIGGRVEAAYLSAMALAAKLP